MSPRALKGKKGDREPLEVVAAGQVDTYAVVSTGYNIAEVWWDNLNSEYHIIITGVDYDFHDYITIVTPNGGDYITSVDSAGGHLVVRLSNGGTHVQCTFSFVTYRVR
jgi:hypothetical protein